MLLLKRNTHKIIANCLYRPRFEQRPAPVFYACVRAYVHIETNDISSEATFDPISKLAVVAAIFKIYVRLLFPIRVVDKK